MEQSDETKNPKNNNKIFNRALFISIPDEDTTSQISNPIVDANNNGYSQEIKHKHSLNGSNNPTPSDTTFGDRYLTHSLLKKLEEGTPLNSKQITIQMDNLNLESHGEGSISEENNSPNNENSPPPGKDDNEDEYIFEKFGKRGWQCEKCNNFNFESRTKCNRCGIPKMPKSLLKIKEENELNNGGEKKKKPLVERKGDWQCPKCRNLNFAFRQSCNRCKLPKPIPNAVFQQTTIPQKKNSNPPINFLQNWGMITLINTLPSMQNNNINNYQWKYPQDVPINNQKTMYYYQNYNNNYGKTNQNSNNYNNMINNNNINNTNQ